MNYEVNYEARAERQLVQRFEEIVGPSLATFVLQGEQVYQDEPWESDLTLRAIERVRLDTALETMDMISATESEDVARAWFIGMNVGEDEISPAEALVSNRFDEVRISAKRLIDDDMHSF